MDTNEEFITSKCKKMVEEDKIFGDGKKFIQFEINTNLTGQDQFASTAVFGNILHTNLDDVKENLTSISTTTENVLVKLDSSNDMLRLFFNSDLQFKNEILFYKDILPFLNNFRIKKDINHFSTFYSGEVRNGVDSARAYIVFKNASYDGYRLSDNKYLLNVKHLLICLRKIGIFHGLSYIAKCLSQTKFTELVNHISETSWTKERLENSDINDLFHSATLERAIAKWRIGDASDKIKSQIDKITEQVINRPIKFMKEITTPVEPMAVICHGDFCRNNILFKYNHNLGDPQESNLTSETKDTSKESTQKTNMESKDSISKSNVGPTKFISKPRIETLDDFEPSDTMFFDMATIRYSSPVMDLSFFLYMNSNKDIRTQYWNELIEEYYTGVRDTVESYAEKNKISVILGKQKYIETNMNGIFLPTLEDIHDEFKINAIYGLVICTFFLPTMMDDTKPTDVDFDWFKLSPEENIANALAQAGEFGTEALQNIAEHILKMDFV